MKTIKIIELLNKIANGEEVPKRIRIREVEYKFTEIIARNLTYSDRGSNINYAYENEFDNYWLDCARINEEVEIIEDAEEDKEIEKIKWNEKSQYNGVTDNTKKTLGILLSRSEQLKKSLNEVIEELNKVVNKLNKGE